MGCSLSATGFRSLTTGSAFDEKPCSFASVAFDSSSKVGRMSNVRDSAFCSAAVAEKTSLEFVTRGEAGPSRSVSAWNTTPVFFTKL